MEADSPPDRKRPNKPEGTPEHAPSTSPNFAEPPTTTTTGRSSLGGDDGDCEDSNSTIHGFNMSNVTVIERLAADTASHTQLESSANCGERRLRGASCEKLTSLPCDGSDSGVEVLDTCTSYRRTLSVNSGASQDLGSLTPARSCDSSILSCCSNYEEAYNILVRRNSTLLEDYTFRHHETAASEHGSESSSLTTGSSSSRNSKRTCHQTTAKKRVSVADNARHTKTTAASKERTGNAKPPLTPRLKSLDRASQQGKSTRAAGSTAKKTATPTTLELKKRDTKTRASSTRTSSTTRTPTATPTDDGRWPSINSKPAPLMSRSLRGMLDTPVSKTPRTSLVETRTIEKYATLPRRRKDKTPSDFSKEGSLTDNEAPSKDRSNKEFHGGQAKDKDLHGSQLRSKDHHVAKDVQKKEKEGQRGQTSREGSINRLAMPKRPGNAVASAATARLLMSQMKRRQKVRIYHEANVQTTLDLADMERILAGVAVVEGGGERCDRGVQADLGAGEAERCREQLRLLTERYEALAEEHRVQAEALKKAEERVMEERVHKEGLDEELRRNRERVLAILGEESGSSDGEGGGGQGGGDSLTVLETRYRAVGQVVIGQEEEIAKLNATCRQLQLELERAVQTQRALRQQHSELEAESGELQDFLQAEKTTLADALREAEQEALRCDAELQRARQEARERREECRRVAGLAEQRRQENLGLQARLGALEAKSRELLVHQGSSVSGASVALSALIGRLDGLVEELVSSYSISEQELEDIIFHNEAYSNSSSSPDATPEKLKKLYMDRTPSPKKGSSFVSAVINAIKNAAAQSPFAALKDTSKDGICTEHSSSNEMLDSETEPCLMMEHVLEDVVVPDGHSHNMISSGHGLLGGRLTHSESLKDLSQAIFTRQVVSEQMSASYAGSLSASFTSDVLSFSEIFPSVSLVDQVIDVDNLVTRLLKVIRIIQLENDDSMNELQEQRDSFAEQVDKQKETNKVVVKQLKDWEVLGARLRSEVKELMQQLSKKNNEIDKIKAELNNQREQVEKLNQDVCELSTALAKAELEMRTKEEEVTEAIKKWEKSGENPTSEVLEKLIVSHNEVPTLKEKLFEKERHLNELTQEFLASRQVLTESLKDAVSEAKKQYQTIDNALEVLHSIQSVVQQCQPLAQLQRELEETSFKSASKMPLSAHPDCNANAGLLQTVTNLEIASPINTTA